MIPPTPADKAPPALPTPPVVPQLTRADLEAFLDGFVPIQLQRDDTAGAVVLVVKDGQVLLAKGYGYSDVKNKKPVTVDGTIFRPGSISKTFIWTAVMQQVEQGKIDLHRDVNDYLDYRIPLAFGKPITMIDLMTHTPGFEETIKELFVANAADMEPLKKYLVGHLPTQIFPAGTTPAYSNYGAALAGYIVQRVSGMPLEEYLERNIFAPLEMRHSTFRQPLPDNLKPLMSAGYSVASKPAKDFEFVGAWPAGSLSATAEDMSHFMIAHLQDGEYHGARILRPETARLMHSRAFELLPSMNGMAYGFYEESRNGHRIIGHGGDSQWFHSDMHLLPADHLGFFVSVNSAGKGEFSFRSALWEGFLDRYFPYTPPPAQKIASAAQDAKSVAGPYWFSRRSDTTLAAVLSAFGQAKVTVNTDGTISIDADKDRAGNPRHYEEIGPLMFRDLNGQGRVAFKRDYGGRQILVTDLPIFVGQPVPPLKNGTLSIAIIMSAIVLFVITLLSWPLNALLRRHYDYHPELPAQYRGSRMFMRLICILNLTFVGGIVAWAMSIEENIGLVSRHFDARLHLLQTVGVLGVIGAVFSVFYLVRSWKTASVWFWTKLWNTLLALGCIGYAWFLLNWHMLNFNLNY
ncbi:MAG: serine hydrolase domain-containing protein [Terriglobales bacterium]